MKIILNYRGKVGVMMLESRECWGHLRGDPSATFQGSDYFEAEQSFHRLVDSTLKGTDVHPVEP